MDITTQRAPKTLKDLTAKKIGKPKGCNSSKSFYNPKVSHSSKESKVPSRRPSQPTIPPYYPAPTLKRSISLSKLLATPMSMFP